LLCVSALPDAQKFTEEELDFQEKILYRSGLGDETAVPPCECVRVDTQGFSQQPLLRHSELVHDICAPNPDPWLLLVCCRAALQAPVLGLCPRAQGV
jgi:hypothetical protein